MKFYVTYAKSVYVCSGCGKTFEALMSIGGWCSSSYQVDEIVSQRMPDIPVGWSSNGWIKGKNVRDLRCESCTKG